MVLTFTGSIISELPIFIAASRLPSSLKASVLNPGYDTFQRDGIRCHI
jgi:hypothetical protein